MSEGVVVAIIGLLSVVLGQTLVQLLQKFFSRAKEKADADMDLRDELRAEIKRKEEELESLRARVTDSDRWRIDYYKLYRAFLDLKSVTLTLLHRSPDDTVEIPEIPPRSVNDDD